MPASLGAPDRWGVELIAHQIDSLARGQAIRALGAWGGFLTLAGCALAGAFIRRAVAARPRAQRAALAAVCVAGLVVAAVLIYRQQHWLLNLPYAVAAFLLAWLAMARLDQGGAA
jgi:hypothetical protein